MKYPESKAQLFVSLLRRLEAIANDHSDISIKSVSLYMVVLRVVYADSAYYDPDGEKNLPKIPVHPIGYDDAKIFLEYVAAISLPSEPI